MRIGLQTWGTDGDILPFIELAKGLKDLGHSVTLAYTSIDGKTYQVEGIKMIAANEAFGLNPPSNPYSMGAKAGSFKEYTLLIKHYFDPFTQSMFLASEELCQYTDLVVGHSICFTLQTAAELHGCPRIPLVLAPMVVQTESVSPTGASFGSLVNRIMWAIGDKVSTRVWFAEGRKLRRSLGLGRIKSLQKEVFTSNLHTIVACSPSVIERPMDWPENVSVVGFLRNETTKVELPEQVEKFLNIGSPPVYMTFGSCMHHHAKAFTDLLVGAAEIGNFRVIIQTPYQHWAFTENPNLLRVDSMHHLSIFPRCSLVVHHGGAGTTQTVLASGKPSVVIAHGFDQLFWSQQLQRSGVGAKPLQINATSKTEVADVIKQVLSNKEMLAKALFIANEMEKENAVQHCIQIIDQTMSALAGSNR